MGRARRSSSLELIFLNECRGGDEESNRRNGARVAFLDDQIVPGSEAKRCGDAAFNFWRNRVGVGAVV